MYRAFKDWIKSLRLTFLWNMPFFMAGIHFASLASLLRAVGFSHDSKV